MIQSKRFRYCDIGNILTEGGDVDTTFIANEQALR